MIRRPSTLKEKELLKKKIGKLDHNEQCEIFNIIRKDTDKISENTNGIFVNLKHLHEDTIQKMNDFVAYCERNKTVITEDNNKQSEEMRTVIYKYDVNENMLNLDKPPIKADTENISECYDNYALTDKPDKQSDDRFSFKTYIDKLSATSTQVFEDTANEKRTVGVRPTKLKLNGVKARIMKTCRNINKTNNTNENPKERGKTTISTFEEILDTTYDNVANDYDDYVSSKSVYKSHNSDDYSNITETSFMSDDDQLKEDSDIE